MQINKTTFFQFVVQVITLAMPCSMVLAQSPSTDATTITVNLDKEIAPMKPVWAWFGRDPTVTGSLFTQDELVNCIITCLY